jgi:hypothetical protein
MMIHAYIDVNNFGAHFCASELVSSKPVFLNPQGVHYFYNLENT